MLLALTCTVLISGGLLASLYMVTKERIDDVRAEARRVAINKVLPAVPNLRLADPETVTLDRIGDFTIVRAYDEAGNYVGAAVESFSRNGYSGNIYIMVGFDAQGNIVDYSILAHRETPGLGTKIIDWFRPQEIGNLSLVERIFGFEIVAPPRQSSIIGKNPGGHDLRVRPDGGIIDNITAATISAQAFLEAVNLAYAAYSNNAALAVDIATGATQVDVSSAKKTEEISAEKTEDNHTVDTTTSATAQNN